MKKLLVLPLVFVLILALGIFWFYQNAKPASAEKSFKDFLITKGASASQIGNKLEDAGLVRSALAFKIYLQFSGRSGNIQAGEFRLTPSFSLFQIVDTLTQGPVEIWVTIPEGLRREEIAARFAKGLDRDETFITEFLKASEEKEGTLFPDTYLFPKEASPSAIVNKLVRTFNSKTEKLEGTSGLDLEDRIILASIIERETKTKAERPVVAGILLNRLEIGMALQVDATLQYAVANSKLKSQNSNLLEKWWEPIVREDLEINSPYNTYKFAGLPPAPIANAGLSSIEAAFNPEESDHLYYMHDGSGGIHYAATLAEHNENVRKYLGK